MKTLSCLASIVLLAAACSRGGHGGEDMSPLADDMSPSPDLAPAPVPASQGIGVNDVSVLFPLPADATGLAALLPLSAMGMGGPLLSTTQFAQFATIQNGDDPSAYGDFRVVAARIDPCFPSITLLTTDPSMCQHQLRLIAQPLVTPDPVNGGTGYGAVDTAMHLLFDIDDASFTALVQAWLALATSQTGNRALPLGVHPTIMAEGLSGKTAAAFDALITQYAGAANLARATIMVGSFATWKSAGFDVSAGVLTPLTIFGIPSNATSQNGTVMQLQSDPTTNGPFDTDADSTTLTGLRPLGGTEVPNPNGEVGSHVVFQSSASAMRSALQLALQVENPTGSFNPNTLDCAACHTASRARVFAMSNGFDDLSGLSQYTNAKRDLSVPGDVAGVIIQQRAFGYRGTTLAINQRAVNESAAVADALEAMQSQ